MDQVSLPRWKRLRRYYSRFSAAFAVFVGCLFLSTANATYNSNIVGVLKSVATYEGGLVLFVLSTQPTSNGTCNASAFVLDPTANTDAQAARLFARLLSAYAAQEAVNIGYDNVGSCGPGNYIHVYSVG